MDLFYLEGITQSVVFCVWLFSFNIMFVSLVHIVAGSSSSLFLIVV